MSDLINWWRNEAIPLWLLHGVDHERGGFFEALDQSSLKPKADFKRLRVLARQIYVFTQAYLDGNEDALPVVERAVDFLFDHAKHPDGGFVSVMSPEGGVLDSKRDLYDNAFALFAMAHAYRVVPSERIKSEALALVRYCDSHFRHPVVGFVESIPDVRPRRQNPHMHILEALIDAKHYIGGDIIEQLARETLALAGSHFVLSGTDVLVEEFDENLSSPVAGVPAYFEPGHHLEWAWLLSTASERGLGDEVLLGRRLAKKALSSGFSGATGLLFGQVRIADAVPQSEVRLWPHAEWLRATTVIQDIASSQDQAEQALFQFLNVKIPGLWSERFSPDTGFCTQPSPASTLYHITGAVMALGR